jgi:hypothetical protein
MTAIPMEFLHEVDFVTPGTANALFEIFTVLERLTGKAPTNDDVFSIARKICGYSFPDLYGKQILAKLRKARTGAAPTLNLVHAAAAPGIEHAGTSVAPVQHPGPEGAAGATRAGDKEYSVTSLAGEISPARDDAPFEPNRAEKSPGFAFGIWFFDAMFEAGIDTARKLFPGSMGLAASADNLQASTALIATHPVDECKIRAGRMFARKMTAGPNQWRGRVSPAKLLEFWEMFGTDEPFVAGAPRLTVVPESDFARRQRESIERKSAALNGGPT